MSTETIRVLLVDDHPVVRDGLRSLFESVDDLEVVGEASDGPSAVARAAAQDPDVILLDLRMPGGGGLEAIQALRARQVRARVLVLSTYDTDREITAALDAGATGYMLKDAPRADLIAAVRAAASGEPVLSPAVASRLVASTRRSGPGELTSRELDVIVLVAQGCSNRQVARTLFVSEATVKTHLSHIYDKLDVRDRAAAVAAAYERRLIGG